MTIRNISANIIALLLVGFMSSCSQQELKTGNAVTNSSNKVKTNGISKSARDKYRSGITALNNNELSKAQRVFNEFIRNNPDLAGGYSNLALVYFKKNEYKKSFKFVNKAIELNPKQAQALNLRAQLYILNGKIHKAKNDYLLAIKSKPNYANAQYNIALLYDIYLQDIELAIKHYKLYMSLLKKKDEGTLEWVKHLQGTLKDA